MVVYECDDNNDDILQSIKSGNEPIKAMSKMRSTILEYGNNGVKLNKFIASKKMELGKINILYEMYEDVSRFNQKLLSNTETLFRVISLTIFPFVNQNIERKKYKNPTPTKKYIFIVTFICLLEIKLSNVDCRGPYIFHVGLAIGIGQVMQYIYHRFQTEYNTEMLLILTNACLNAYK